MSYLFNRMQTLLCLTVLALAGFAYADVEKKDEVKIVSQDTPDEVTSQDHRPTSMSLHVLFILHRPGFLGFAVIV